MMCLTTVKSPVGGGGGGGGGGSCFVVAIPPQPAKIRVRPRTSTPTAFNIRPFDEFGSLGVVQRRSWKVTICRARRGFALLPHTAVAYRGVSCGACVSSGAGLKFSV